MRRILPILLTLFALASFAQSTTVTLQVTDADGTAWANGTWTTHLVSLPGFTPGPPFNLVGSATPVPNQLQSGTLSTTGSATLTLTPNGSIAPFGTAWYFSVCPQATADCYRQQGTVAGTTQTITLVPPAIRIPGATALPTTLAYNDIEIFSPSVGTQYFNLTLLAQRQWNGFSWSNLGSGSVQPPAAISSITVTPNPVSFGTVQTSIAATIPLTITNIGTNNSVLSALNLNSSTGEFTLVNPTGCNGTLSPNIPCTSVSVQYIPVNIGTDTATLTATANPPIDPSNPVNVAISGTGQAAPSFTLTTTLIGSGGGSISDGASFTCSIVNGSSSPCSAGYASGTPVTITPTANSNTTFAGFTLDGSGCANPCPVTMSANHAITATFNLTPPTFVTTISAIDQGIGSVASDLSDIITGSPLSCTFTSGVLTAGGTGGVCKITLNQGAMPVFTATPSGSCTGGACTFLGFGGVAVCAVTPVISTCQPTITANTSISVDFAQPVGNGPLTPIQNAVTGTGTNSITAAWSQLAQNAGDFIACAGVWNDATTTVSSVTDTKGNPYTQVSAGRQAFSGLTTVLYYAPNIVAAAAGANTTTMALSAAPSFRKLLCREYSGVLASPADGSVGATGTGTALSSGALTTTTTNDLLIGVDNVNNGITVVSTGFTQQIFISGNDFEDNQGKTASAYTFAPTQGTSSAWTTILAAFKTGGTTNTFSVNMVINGNGSVAGSGLNCPSTCSISVQGGNPVSFTATPGSSNVTFTGYVGGGCDGSASCTIPSIITNTNITANFSTTITCAGPFTITSQPPASCPFYGQGTFNVTNKLKPADIGSHGATNGDVIAQTAFAGNSIQFFTPGSDDRGIPLWISRPTDPFYQTGGCTTSTFTGGIAFRAPNNANTTDQARPDIPASGDAFIRVWDPSTGIVLGAYPGGQSSATPFKIGVSSATSATGAPSIPNTVACGAAKNIFTDQDWGKPYGWLNGQGAEGSMGLAPFAGIVRSQELISGQINHALVLGVACTNAYTFNGQTLFHVFPSSLDTSHCTVATTMPPNGALLYLDYTDAQIAALGLPAWQKTLYTAMAHYGGYVDVTGGSGGTGGLTFEMESPMVYQLMTGGTVTAAANGMVISGGTPDPVTAFLVSQGFVFNGGSGTSTKTTPVAWLLSGALSHIHMASPCIAGRYANQSFQC